MQSTLKVDVTIYDELWTPTVTLPSDPTYKFAYVKLRGDDLELEFTVWNSDNARKLADALNDAADQLDRKLGVTVEAEPAPNAEERRPFQAGDKVRIIGRSSSGEVVLFRDDLATVVEDERDGHVRLDSVTYPKACAPYWQYPVGSVELFEAATEAVPA